MVPHNNSFPSNKRNKQGKSELSHLELVSLLTGLTPTVWPWWRHYFVHFYIDPSLKWPLYSNTFCIIQSSNVIVFHIHIPALLQAHSVHIPHHKHTNTHIHITNTAHKFTAKRNLCFCLCMCYGNAMFKMHSGNLDKDLTYCKGVIKPNF